MSTPTRRECRREGCSRRPPDLPYIDGAGQYCAQSCAAGVAPLFEEPYERPRTIDWSAGGADREELAA